MTPLTLAVVALTLALIALVGFAYLLASIWLDRADPEPPAWVNDGHCRPRARRGNWREDCRP